MNSIPRLPDGSCALVLLAFKWRNLLFAMDKKSSYWLPEGRVERVADTRPYAAMLASRYLGGKVDPASLAHLTHGMIFTLGYPDEPGNLLHKFPVVVYRLDVEQRSVVDVEGEWIRPSEGWDHAANFYGAIRLFKFIESGSSNYIGFGADYGTQLSFAPGSIPVFWG